jgi:hypothetical protein
MVDEKPILARRHGHRIASGRRTQKPSSASPTQLNANNEQTSAATDAKVAIVLADRMTNPLWKTHQTLTNDLCPIMARIGCDK